jgi:DNA-binding response OmpR family regulator
MDTVLEKTQDIVLAEGDSYERLAAISHDVKQAAKLPMVLLLQSETLSAMSGHLGDVDDFVVAPFDAAEVELRLRRLLRPGKSSDGAEEMTCGALRIDLARCEVTVAGRPVVLTFKEYELLKYLVSNQGRVCTREALLDRVWGFEYYGGDRTVDVHIRRLRSKIEDAAHTFVDTVRNVGYRFRAEG